MEDPDYSKYTYSELQGVLDRIDKEKYPKRYEKALNQLLIIEERGDNGNLKTSKWLTFKTIGAFVGLFSIYNAAMFFYKDCLGIRSCIGGYPLFSIESYQTKQVITFLILVVGFYIGYWIWRK